jgi:antitoxin HicB
MVAMMETHQEVERLLALPYRIELIPDDGEWVVAMPELPGCVSQGATIEEALAMIKDAQRGWLEVRLEAGLPIPQPETEPDHRLSGKFNVRVPKDLHRALVAAARAQGVSLNLYVATVLARSAGLPGPLR